MRERRLALHFALCLTLTACGAARDAETSAAEDAIVGDARADHERPEVVNLDVEKDGALFTCTGTLVGRRTVLTARHCILGRVDAAGACPVTALVDRLGRGTLDPSVERYAATRCDVRDTGALLESREDLATLRLDRAVVGARPVSLAKSDAPSGRYTVYGYGSFGRGPSIGTRCEHRGDGHKRSAQYVGSLFFRFGQATCPGDSGGPHFVEGTSVLAGVTSAGGSLLAAYEVNTEVAPHRAWILERIAAYGDAPAP